MALYFYSGSKNVPAGKGIHESGEYENLPDNFRRVLSNFHVYPFKWNGYTWNSIEHAFQGSKIWLQCEEKGRSFTIEGGDTSDGLSARKRRKCVILTPQNLRIWNAQKESIMYEISLAKYSQCKEASEILKNTKSAELWHIQMRAKPVRFVHLEKIREILNHTLGDTYDPKVMGTPDPIPMVEPYPKKLMIPLVKIGRAHV